MANYYYDCEFLEGKQDKRFFGIKYGETKNTIDLISIGVVADDGREFYAVSQDFNLEEAWNRWQPYPNPELAGINKKWYWLRENVLEAIFTDWQNMGSLNAMYEFSYKNFKSFLSCYGKTNKQIAEELEAFVKPVKTRALAAGVDAVIGNVDGPIHLYGYYSSYDHVCLSWLYGKMINLPDGFPYYTRDLQQMLDEKWISELKSEAGRTALMLQNITSWKEHPKYPKQTNEHNALSDSRWNKELHEFIKKL